MARSTFSALKPAYLFTPKNLVRRVWLKFFPSDLARTVVRLPWGSFIEIDLTETIGGEIFKQGGAVDVVADFAGHVHGIAETGGGDGLVGSLAAGGGGETGSDNSLADAWYLRGEGHHVHGDAADYDDGFWGGSQCADLLHGGFLGL